MDTWAPLFSKIVDSSLWREEDWVIKIFLTMLAKKDRDHVVRATAYMIGEWAKKDEETALRALKILSSPDTRRKEPQPFEGRRVEKVEDGWLILNGAKYRQVLSDAVTRERKRLWAEEQRRKKGMKPRVKPANGPASLREAQYERQLQEGLGEDGLPTEAELRRRAENGQGPLLEPGESPL